MPASLKATLFEEYSTGFVGTEHLGGAGHACLPIYFRAYKWCQVWDRRTSFHVIKERTCSIYLYDIDEGDESFWLELRDIPLSIPVERILKRLKCEETLGQIHHTYHLRVDVLSLDKLRELSNAIGKVRDGGRLGVCTVSGYEASQALLGLVRTLDSYWNTKQLHRKNNCSVSQQAKVAVSQLSKIDYAA